MAQPLRFRRSHTQWTPGRVESDVFRPLDANLGAQMGDSWFKPPEGFEARRFEMDNGDIALFLWDPDGTDGAWWLGNTETPSSLWRTDKQSFREAPYQVTRWAQRELLAQLHDEDPWLANYPHVSWFFLPVFLSKDGRETSRAFFREDAAGFPDTSADEALTFYEDTFRTGALDEYRHIMAGKLGTSEYRDRTRMAAAMGEFNAARILVDAGYDITPEIEVSTGHSLDYKAQNGEAGYLVEVTRPLPTSRRSANSPVAALRDTAQTKTSGQLDDHGGGAVLFVDCSSFPQDEWRIIMDQQSEVHHRPAVVYRVRPDGSVEGYSKGRVPLDLDWL